MAILVYVSRLSSPAYTKFMKLVNKEIAWSVSSVKSNPGYAMTTQEEVRDSFWSGMSPLYRNEYRPSKRQNDYSADIRMMWVGYIDDLARNGIISENLAARVTL